MNARLAAGVSALAGIALVVVLAGHEPSSSGRQTPLEASKQPGSIGALQISRDNGPLLSGKSMSIGEAEASIAAITEGQFRLIRPNHDSANDSNVRNVFLESPLGDDGNPTFQLAIDYESGLLLIIRPASQDYGFAEDAETQYTEMAAGYPNPEFARLETIHGVPALVIDRNDRGTAYVDLVLEGLRIQLRGAYAPIESAVLVEVAESMS